MGGRQPGDLGLIIMRTARHCWPLLLVLLCAPGAARAQEEPVEVEEVEEAPSPLVGAAWCVVLPAEDRGKKREKGEVGCDGGVGAAFWQRGRWAAVGALGRETLVFGGAYILNPGARNPLAIALGAGVPWDTSGVYMEPALFIGGTISWKGGE